MPNPGGIYLGCERCRQRKIKVCSESPNELPIYRLIHYQCDRASPNCRRCVVHGMPCPGYPRTRDVIFRDETLKTMRKASVGVIFENTAVSEEHTSPHDLNVTVQKMSSPPVYGSLRLSDAVTSTYYFMHQLVIPVGWYPLIPKFYQESGPEGCLKWAVDAASMFLYANRTGEDHLLIQARTLYSSALNAINITISDPVERLRDETLCAILILNIIDVRTS